MRRRLRETFGLRTSELVKHESSYRYDTLPGKESIRLLHLSKDKHGVLRFDLEPADLRQSPTCEAISFTWGDDTRTHCITHVTTGQKLYITKNCADMLPNLVHEGGKALRIDTICIDQEDTRERSAQVAAMDRIFHCASRTVAYVGDVDENSSLVFADCYHCHGDGHPVVPKMSDGRHFAALFQRSWFSRLWVLQEVLLSANIIVQAGLDSFPFFDLAETAFENRGTIIRDSANSKGGSSFPKVFLVAQAQSDPPFFGRRDRTDVASSSSSSRGVQRKLGSWQLFDVLYDTNELQCRDPRDKVFAILSLFRGDLMNIIQPDYSQTVRGTFTKVTRHLLQAETTAALSSAVGFDQASELPSWVIDWRDPPSRKFLLESWSQYSSWHAGFALQQRQVIATFNIPGAVTLRGKRVTKITRIPSSEVSSRGWRRREKLTSGSSHDHRLIVILEDENEGYALRSSRPGDEIVGFLGFEVPFVLRQQRLPKLGWSLVGECYVEHIMKGQAVEDVDWNTIASDEPMAPLDDFDIY